MICSCACDGGGEGGLYLDNLSLRFLFFALRTWHFSAPEDHLRVSILCATSLTVFHKSSETLQTSFSWSVAVHLASVWIMFCYFFALQP